jgi:hypothetical protein
LFFFFLFWGVCWWLCRVRRRFLLLCVFFFFFFKYVCYTGFSQVTFVDFIKNVCREDEEPGLPSPRRHLQARQRGKQPQSHLDGTLQCSLKAYGIRLCAQISQKKPLCVQKNQHNSCLPWASLGNPGAKAHAIYDIHTCLTTRTATKKKACRTTD